VLPPRPGAGLARTDQACEPSAVAPNPVTAQSDRASAERALRGEPVAREVFTGLPDHYDRLAYLLSLGQDRRWRRAVVDRAATGPPQPRIGSCGHLLPNPPKLEKRLHWLLGRTALGLASSAFDKGQRHVSEQLADFACQTCPSVTRSLSWAKLACRRTLGYQAWNGLQLAAARVRCIGTLPPPSVKTSPLCPCGQQELSQAMTPESDAAPSRNDVFLQS